MYQLAMDLVSLLAALYLCFRFWVFVTKRRIYKLFNRDREKWWLFFQLQRNVRSPALVVRFALTTIKEESALEVKMMHILGMYHFVDSVVLPVLQPAYKLSGTRKGSGLKSTKRHQVPSVVKPVLMFNVKRLLS